MAASITHLLQNVAKLIGVLIAVVGPFAHVLGYDIAEIVRQVALKIFDLGYIAFSMRQRQFSL